MAKPLTEKQVEALFAYIDTKDQHAAAAKLGISRPSIQDRLVSIITALNKCKPGVYSVRGLAKHPDYYLQLLEDCCLFGHRY